MAASLRRNGKFAKALGAAMKREGMNVSNVASAIGVKRATVQSWLNGSEPLEPNFRKLVKLFPELAKFGAS